MRYSLAIILLCLCHAYVHADEVYLKNGDKITGKIIAQDNDAVTVRTQAMGEVMISSAHIQRTATDEELAQEKRQSKQDVKKWKGSVSLGYSDRGGNTDKSQGSLDVKANRKGDANEWTLKYSAYISTSNNKTDAREFYAMGRYAYSFGKNLKWYHFYKLEGSQDRFANVDARITPSSGVGYWFSDEEDYKAMVELALGYEHTTYVAGSSDDDEVILVPRGYFEKVLIGDLRFAEDLTLYPSLSETGEFRLRSETSLINPISDRLSWKISYIDEYDSDPAGGVERNDYRVVSSLDYSF